MNKPQPINLKDDSLLRKKKQLNLALNVLISALGVSSLFIKIFLLDGLIALRFFTVDGNLFTTVVSVIAVWVNLRELKAGRENESRRMYFLQLSSAVTEAVIFIVVMAGYLPVFPDEPVITPYHMFCLHVAIPVLAVLRFAFFEKPCGILPPSRLLIGAIPIGVYGFGVVNAIKLGILPVSMAPYSFLDFENNFLWYFVFALVVIPVVGFLWSWLFYRLNLRASLLWYRAEDLEKLQIARVKALSRFDGINSSILIIYCALAVTVLMFSLHSTSQTSTKVQNELMAYISFYMTDDFSNMIDNGAWEMKDGSLYKGGLRIGDGTEENAVLNVFPEKGALYDYTVYVQAANLSPEIAAKYDGLDYVAVSHSAGEFAPVRQCGESLEDEVVARVIASNKYDKHLIYEEAELDGVSYYHCCIAFGDDLWNSGTGIIELYFPASQLVTQAKNAEYNADLEMVVVVFAAFALLYILTNKWIRVLEKSVDFLRAIGSGRTPEKPITLGRSILFSGLERQLNVIREINEN